MKSTQEDADEFNPSSIAQLQQLLFAPFKREKVTKAQTENDDNNEDGLDFEEAEIDEPKRKNKKTELDEFPVERSFTVLNTKVNFALCGVNVELITKFFEENH